MFYFEKQMNRKCPGPTHPQRHNVTWDALLRPTCTIKAMDNRSLSRRSFDLTVSAPKKQRSAEVVAVSGLSVASGIRNNSQMGRRTVQTFVCESLGMFLDPCEELVQLDDVLKLWLGCVLLQCTDMRNNIHSGVCKIRDGAKEKLVQLTKVWACFVVGLS